MNNNIVLKQMENLNRTEHCDRTAHEMLLQNWDRGKRNWADFTLFRHWLWLWENVLNTRKRKQMWSGLYCFHLFVTCRHLLHKWTLHPEYIFAPTQRYFRFQLPCYLRNRNSLRICAEEKLVGGNLVPKRQFFCEIKLVLMIFQGRPESLGIRYTGAF